MELLNLLLGKIMVKHDFLGHEKIPLSHLIKN
jgi:hypothetical protein